MPHYHVCGVVCTGCGGCGTVLYASVPGGRYESWSCFDGLVDFPGVPIRNMARGDYFDGTLDELCLAAAIDDKAYMKYYVCKENETGGLRLFVQPSPAEPWFIYDMVMLVEPPVAAINTTWQPYPQPCAWH